MGRLSYKEVEKRLNHLIKVEIFTAKLEGRENLVNRVRSPVKYLAEYDARERVETFRDNYDNGEYHLRRTVLWGLIEHYPIKVPFRDFQRYCKWVHKKRLTRL
jgi:hypothetical protein